MNYDWEKEYARICQVESDINEHLPVLYNLCNKSNTTKELGIGFGVSTRAFLAAIATTHGALNSYDIEIKPNVAEFYQLAKNDGLNFTITCQNTLEAPVYPVDFLFVDSLHTYSQVQQELERHAYFTKKYIAFHDIVSFGEHGEIPNFPNKLQGSGILRAINEWRQINKEWKTIGEYYNNNGLLVLEK